MKTNLNMVLTAFPSAGEEAIAARVAQLHNASPGGGTWWAPLANVMSRDYVKKFLGDTPGNGEWRSLRCTQDSGSTVTTVAPGTNGTGIGGLQFTALPLY